MPSVQLPRANLHADLFRDNVLFDGPHLAGLIDFYNACSGWMLYDLAITLNDWCSNTDGSLDPARARALLAAYANRRPFTALEAEHWPSMPGRLRALLAVATDRRRGVRRTGRADP